MCIMGRDHGSGNQGICLKSIFPGRGVVDYSVLILYMVFSANLVRQINFSRILLYA